MNLLYEGFESSGFYQLLLCEANLGNMVTPSTLILGSTKDAVYYDSS